MTLLFSKSLSNGQVKNRQSKRVPEFTIVRDERVKILVNSCIRKMDKIGMRSRKSYAAKLQEGEGMQLANSEEQSA